MQIRHSLIQAYAAVTSEKTEVGETQMFVSMCNDLPVLLPLKRLLQRQGLQLQLQTGAFSVTFARQHSDKEAVRQNQVGSYMQSLCDVRVTAINCDELMKITNLLSPYIDIHIRAHTEPRI